MLCLMNGLEFLKVNMENSYGIDKVLKEMRMVL